MIYATSKRERIQIYCSGGKFGVTDGNGENVLLPFIYPTFTNAFEAVVSAGYRLMNLVDNSPEDFFQVVTKNGRKGICDISGYQIYIPYVNDDIVVIHKEQKASGKFKIKTDEGLIIVYKTIAGEKYHELYTFENIKVQSLIPFIPESTATLSQLLHKYRSRIEG